MNVTIIRSIISLVASVGAGTLVGVVAKPFMMGLKGLNKALSVIGLVCLSNVVGNAAGKYAEETVDDVLIIVDHCKDKEIVYTD